MLCCFSRGVIFQGYQSRQGSYQLAFIHACVLHMHCELKERCHYTPAHKFKC